MRAEELAGMIGDDAAMLFMSRVAGQRYFVPKSASKRLVEQAGQKGAESLAREYGGSYIFVPVGRPWRVMKLHRDGLSIQQIALAMCMSAKQVRDIVKGEAGQGREAAPPALA